MFLGDHDRIADSKWASDVVDAALSIAGESNYEAKNSHELLQLHMTATADGSTLLATYDYCRAAVETALASFQRVIVWHLPGQEGDMDPISDSSDPYQRLCSMLALAFPDVALVPVSQLSDVLLAIGLWRSGYDPIFDGTSRRDSVRALMMAKAAYLPRRERLAIALDDEISYAQLHAYVAYRFGFRSVAISTAALGNIWLKQLSGDTKNTRLELTMEDLYLSFPDLGTFKYVEGEARKSARMSILAERDQVWGALKSVKHRIFLTSDHNPAKWRANESYLRRHSKDYRSSKLHKPHAGMFRVWEAAGLMGSLRWDDGKVHGGRAPGFVWPPPTTGHSDEDGAHSSPGILKMLAEHMLQRAERLLPNVQSVTDAVRGAVLAGDALELLGARTPTLAIEALRLKHQFEVLAECQFSGVEHHLPLRGRLAEIDRDIKAICQWFGTKQRSLARINAEMAILTVLVRVFREFGQFDEEQECISRVRHLHNTLYLKAHPWTGWLLWPFLRYSEYLLASLARFQIAFLGWIVALTGLFYAAEEWGLAKKLDNDLHPLSNAISTFFGAEALVSDHPAWILITIVSILGGFAHLAIFISHLYVLVSRR
jgi:hypothetical protein